MTCSVLLSDWAVAVPVEPLITCQPSAGMLLTPPWEANHSAAFSGVGCPLRSDARESSNEGVHGDGSAVATEPVPAVIAAGSGGALFSASRTRAAFSEAGPANSVAHPTIPP